MAPSARPKAYSYLRFSTPEQAQGDSFRRQTALAITYAAAHGLDLDDGLSFQDLGISAFRSRNTSQGSALRDFLDAVETCLVATGSFLLVESLDRISRDNILAAQGIFMQIIGAGIQLVTLSDGRSYSAASINASPTDLIISIVGMMRAHEESATKSRRLSAVWAAKRQRSQPGPLTARCPGWLQLSPDRARFDVIDDRANIVRHIFQETINGVGKESIARGLNRDLVRPFGRALKWHKSYIAKILNNPAAIGIFVPHRMEHEGIKKRRVPQDAFENYFPPVISADMFENAKALQAGSGNPRRGLSALRPLANIFGGFARCALCGSAMTLTTKSRKWRYLVCTKAKSGMGCSYHSISYAAFEEQFISSIEFIIESCPHAVHGETFKESIAITTELENAQNRRDRLISAIAESGAAQGAMDRIRDEEEAITGMKKRLVAIDRQNVLSLGPSLTARLGQLGAASRTMPLDRAGLNAALRTLFSHFEIDPLRPRIGIAWRHGPRTMFEVSA